MNERAAPLLSSLPERPSLIEIGPSYNPLAPKRDGWNTTVVDHATRDGLLAKYAPDPSVNPDAIEDVDYVWQGGALSDLIPASLHGTFDGFLAAHVIEHTPDIIRFLQSAETLLAPGGQVLLIVPDKRKCFDLFRPVSMASDALIAFAEKRQRHTGKTLFENAAYVSHRNGWPAWHMDETAPSVLVSSLAQGWASMQAAAGPDYIDAHAWTFTPASFELMMLELASLGFLDLNLTRVEEAPATEFYAWLRKGTPSLKEPELGATRLDLLNRMMLEVAQRRLEPDAQPPQSTEEPEQEQEPEPTFAVEAGVVEAASPPDAPDAFMKRLARFMRR